MKKIELSVRSLVEFLLCEGDIQSGFSSVDRALLGSQIHRQIQKQHGSEYEKEVFLKNETVLKEYQFIVEGRADGVFLEKDLIIVEEIKTISGSWDTYMNSPVAAHWGQAKCYAYFYAKEHGLSSITIQLTYYHIKEEQAKYLRHDYSYNELETFYLSLLTDYLKWADMQTNWQTLMHQSAQNVTFPFSAYRKGQRELATAVYKSIRTQTKLYCMAPTGIGKTIATVFATVKAVGEGLCEKILYMTAKTTTRAMAEKAMDMLHQNGLHMKYITLTAKDKICFLAKRDCRPEICPYAKGYYNRLLKALFSILTTHISFTRDTIEACAKEYCLCPFELSLDLSDWCDVIIGDYNYLFDPQVSLKRLFANKIINPYVYLIDEAHNLVDRSRHMYSASIHKASFLALKRLLGKNSPLSKEINAVNTLMLSYRKECENKEVRIKNDLPSDLIHVLFRFCAAASQWLMTQESAPHYDEVIELYFMVQSFLKIAALYNEHYITWFRAYKSDVTIKLLCQNPSSFLNERMQSGVSSVLFSATMMPLLYYKEILGGDVGDKLYAVHSPFPLENLCLIACNYVSTRYVDRDKTLGNVCEAIYDMVMAKKGNYMVFFPSYQYLNKAADYFHNQYPSLPFLCQTEQMSEEERDTFLNHFHSSSPQSLLTFCVLGGAFSEGIDLAGDKLIGAAIIGVGMPQINFEQNLLRDYFDQSFQKGFEYAYRYPGMNKVLQAAGRVIRSCHDRGVVLLIDDRYKQPAYQTLMPSHWKNRLYTNSPKETKQILAQFWKEKEEKTKE